MITVTAAGLFAANGHGPGRNPWWVNVMLVVLVIGVLIAWRLRAARKKRSRQQSEFGQAGEP